ncbi:hypothetical protein [Algoriphagus sp. A40]|uniref:DUF7674 family protein n=1 Tax=Algoriphagus sp. A40 TaxID=1945863 RepID=UPI00098640C1|nr:hypothetical protein [Algoriphagus sp. A40]OOG77636.1 hypothetical protein B0E43_04370 [Algoriphagus sp. A40]
MENLIRQLQEGFPKAFPEYFEKDEYQIYRVLRYFGNRCAQYWESSETRQILSLITKVYQRENLFLCNAIENEFLATMAMRLDTDELMDQLKVMPESLLPVYLKVLIETKKTQ